MPAGAQSRGVGGVEARYPTRTATSRGPATALLGLAHETEVCVDVVGALGRGVWESRAQRPAGQHRVPLDLSDLPGGYGVQATAAGLRAIHRVVVAR